MKKAFTLIELLVVIAIIAILAAILFPVFAQAKDAAKKTSSLSNVKQMATSNFLYMADSDDVFVLGIDDNLGSNPVQYQISWMLKLQPYMKSLEILYSPGASGKRPITPTSSGDSLTQYAMFPRWQVYSGAAPGPGNTWRTFWAQTGALTDGVVGYAADVAPAGGWIGDADFCGTGANHTNRQVQSMTQTNIARVAETALLFDARGWDYGFLCFNINPAPLDAMPPSAGAAFEGVSFDGRYTFEGVRRLNNVNHRIGRGAVAFTDGHAAPMQTTKFFQTIPVSGNRLAYRYQYSQE